MCDVPPPASKHLRILCGGPTFSLNILHLNTFTLNDYSDIHNPKLIELKTLENDPFKFLSSTITFKNTSLDHYQLLENLLKPKLENLDKCSVRGEYKVAIYSRYLLPSLRFHLSVHAVHQTHLDKLDHQARQYLKKWLGFPSRGVSDLSIFHPYMLGLKTPSQVYLEGHAGNFMNSMVRGDPVVKEALAVGVSREAEWSRKSSTLCECRNIFEKVSENSMIPNQSNTYHFATAARLALPNLKKQTNMIIREKFLEKFNEQAEETNFQGELLTLLKEEKSDITWKAFIYSVPKGVMAFAMRSSTNSLATPDNLARCINFPVEFSGGVPHSPEGRKKRYNMESIYIFSSKRCNGICHEVLNKFSCNPR